MSLSASRLNRRTVLRGLAGGAAGAALAACGGAPATSGSPTTPDKAASPAADAKAAPATAAPAAAEVATIRVLTADFFYDAMVLPATAIFNDANQGKTFVKAEKAPEGWLTKVVAMVRDKNVLWSSYAVDSFFNLYQRIQTGVAAPIDDYIKASNVSYAKTFKDQYIAPTVYEAALFEGKQYYMPTKVNMTIVPHNTTMLNGAGYDKIPETWDEVRVMLRKIKEMYAKDDVIPTSINLDLWRSVGGIFCTFTDKPYNAEGMVDLDSDAWFDALELMKSFHDDGLANTALLGSPDEMTTWQKGKLAVIWNYPSWLNLAQTAWGRQTYNAGLMPKPNASDKQRTWLHIDGTYLIANAPHPQETVDWMLTILGPEGEAADTFARGSVSRSGSPMFKTHIESPIVKGNPDYPWLYDSYKMMDGATAAPLSPYHFLVDAKGKKYLPQYFKGEISAKEATDKIKQEVEQDKSKMLSGEG
jgi:hypothetical protein